MKIFQFRHDLKAVKNRVEIENIREGNGKRWSCPDQDFSSGLNKIMYPINFQNFLLGEKLNIFRSENENYLGPSFSTIVAFNDHGALPHYSACFRIRFCNWKDGILLVDSGGQYLDGTTDITRTIAIGKPTDKQKRDFSLVLKGTINLALAKFPAGTRGYQLDISGHESVVGEWTELWSWNRSWCWLLPECT